MFKLSENTKQIIEKQLGLSWDHIIIKGIPKIKKVQKMYSNEYRKLTKKKDV